MNIRKHRSTQGQTIIIVILVLAILLGLGLIFSGIIARNIKQSSASRKRTVASDLAEAAVRYAHFQLVHSPLGADWRITGSPLVDAGGFSRDPDALYLRPGTGLRLGKSVVDAGGPDGLGTYARINYDKGRALLRVRWAPADWNNFESGTGAMRQPGKARNYIMIESVGRSGSVNINDPSTLAVKGVKVSGYANQAEFDSEFGKLKQFDSLQTSSRKLIGFATIGIIEAARFITNKDQSSQLADIGSLTSTASDPTGLGLTYEGQEVRLRSEYGGVVANNTTNAQVGTGQIYSNAGLNIHGFSRFFLNPGLGDGLFVAGPIRNANDASTFELVTPTNTFTITGNNLDSRNAGFQTEGGIFRDGSTNADPDGYTRSTPRKEPPSIQEEDPATKVNRYITLTRDSGKVVNGRNSGQYGYGEGIFVSATAGDRGDAQDEDARINQGATRALVQDWLNPNKAASANSGGWVGPFYIPLASNVELFADGFRITRDSRARGGNNIWRTPTGQAFGASMRFRLISLGSTDQIGDIYVINEAVSPDLMTLPALQVRTNFAARVQNEGFKFNGVLYFDADVQVRGVIPTNQQLSIVSMGTIYISGSITKGVTNDQGATIGYPSKSICALMAKDYITVNTTQFFAPAPGETPNAKDSRALRDAPNAVEVQPSETLTLQGQFLFNPADDAGLGSQRNNPATWHPFVHSYQEFGTNVPIETNLVAMHSADADGPSFATVGILPVAHLGGGTNFVNYLFDSYAGQATELLSDFNSEIRQYLGPGTNKVQTPIYGLVNGSRNTYPKFESISVPLASPTSAFAAGSSVIGGTAGQGYGLALTGETKFRIGLTGLEDFTTKNYELARFSAIPHDIRIEAICFAEEGSFFVIPGVPFNINNQDTRAEFDANVTALGLKGAIQERYNRHGAMPSVPFYSEAPNIRIVVSGSVSENMPVPISQQAQWQKMWGWMPRKLAGTGLLIPRQHVPNGYNISGNSPQNWYVPNLIFSYDPTLGLGTASNDPTDPVRSDNGQMLPPAPRLPVSPQLAYFGEVNP